MSSDYQGNPYQSPITLRTHAPRQTHEQGSPRLTRTRPTSAIPDTTGDDNPDAWEEGRTHTSARRYDLPTSRQTTQLRAKPTTKFSRRRVDRPTLVIWLCLALIVMIVGWWLLSWVSTWWQGVQDNLKYGSPRTFQADQYVGLGDSPAHPDHFIALNLHGVIEVVQINPADSAKDTVYVLTSVSNESVPASLSFRDVTGNGKMDIVVTIGDATPYTIVMLNDGKTFQPTQAPH